MGSTNISNFSKLTDNEKILTLSLILNRVQDDTARHEKVLITGNGELPLVERVRNHENFINGLKRWLNFLVGAILLQTLAVAGAVIAYFFKLYPLLERLANGG